MTRFSSQTEALNYLSLVAETAGTLCPFEAIEGLGIPDNDGSSLAAGTIAGIMYEKQQTMLLDSMKFNMSTNVLLGSFTCKILHAHPDIADSLNPQLNITANEPGAVIVNGKFNYWRGFEAKVLAERQVAYSMKQGAGQFLDWQFGYTSSFPAHDIFVATTPDRLIGGFAMRQQRHDDPLPSVDEMHIVHHAIENYPQLEILGIEQGLTPTTLPNLAEWIAEDFDFE